MFLLWLFVGGIYLLCVVRLFLPQRKWDTVTAFTCLKLETPRLLCSNMVSYTTSPPDISTSVFYSVLSVCEFMVSKHIEERSREGERIPQSSHFYHSGGIQIRNLQTIKRTYFLYHSEMNAWLTAFVWNRERRWSHFYLGDSRLHRQPDGWHWTSYWWWSKYI